MLASSQTPQVALIGQNPRAYVLVQSEFRGERFRHLHADHQHDRGACIRDFAFEGCLLCDVAADWRLGAVGNIFASRFVK